MFDLSALLHFIPKPVGIGLSLIVIGGLGFAGHEIRYMTVADFTKSYVLDLKREIRELTKDLVEIIDPVARAILQEQLDALLDDLCYERPDDAYCR